jgi:PKD domain
MRRLRITAGVLAVVGATAAPLLLASSPAGAHLRGAAHVAGPHVAGPHVAGPHVRATTVSSGASTACAAPRPTHQGRFRGVIGPDSAAAERSGCPAASNGPTAMPAMPATSKGYNGTPPLVDNGGPVMGTAGDPGAIEITPIYWDPGHTFSAAYENVIDGFVANMAADSGKLTDVFSAELQYGIHYSVTAGAAVVDSDPFPSNGCAVDAGPVYADNSGYAGCLTDAQLVGEGQSVVSHRGLPADLAHLYLIFLPKGVESCFTNAGAAQGGSCSVNPNSNRFSFCGYHSNAGSFIYSDQPFPIYDSPTGSTCSPQYGPGNQSPNGELDADVELYPVSHESIEATTDPLGNAWLDRSGNEIGDDCAFIYGGGFGGSPGAEYNQTINGAHYFIQEEFSNQNFAASRKGSCIQRVDLPAVGGLKVPGSATAGHRVAMKVKKPLGVSSYSWDFGDHSPVGTTGSVTHVYSSRGVYTVKLTLTDVVGFQNSSAVLAATVNVS